MKIYKNYTERVRVSSYRFAIHLLALTKKKIPTKSNKKVSELNMLLNILQRSERHERNCDCMREHESKDTQ